MLPRTVIVCAQCSAVVEDDPVALGDELFCCLGCVGGGPCICEHHDLTSLSLQIGPFTAQPDLLRFAARLEQAPGLVHVELTRPDLDEAQFAVVAASAAVLVLAVEANPDFAVTAEVSGNRVFAHVAPPRRARAIPPADDLLPTRARFRVFRSVADATTAGDAPGAAAPSTPAPAGDSPEAEVADLLANARAAAAMHVRLPDHEPSVRERRYAPPPAPETAAPVETVTPAEAAPPLTPDAPTAGEAVSMTVVGGPFPSFQAVNEFQGTLSAVHGVQRMQVRRFYKGTLNLIVEYLDEVPLADRLREAAGAAWIVHTVTEDRVELRVTSDAAFVGARRA